MVYVHTIICMVSLILLNDDRFDFVDNMLYQQLLPKILKVAYQLRACFKRCLEDFYFSILLLHFFVEYEVSKYDGGFLGLGIIS